MSQSYLENSVLRICQQPRTFEYISKSMNGLDPSSAYAILKKLENEGKLTLLDDLWVIKEISVQSALQLYPNETTLYLQKYMGYFDFLKTPHPLDFEWRNSTSSLHRLINKIQFQTTNQDKLLFLGMPTLFATAILKDIPYHISLIERNKPIIQGLNKIVTDRNRFRIIEADIFEMNPNIIAEHFCVVMDPPWYTPHFLQFMWLAAKSISIGGLVAISLPPINTRPNIMKERIEWFTFCHSLGLCLEMLEPQQLEYAMPFFEFNALRADGINNVMPFWRKGDLAIFRKTAPTTIARPVHKSINTEWVEREHESVRIRVRLLSANCEKEEILKIESIIKGDILPTVSNRDVRRKSADIWTSGNRIYQVNNPGLFLRTIDHVLKNAPATENERIVGDFLKMLSELEKSEFKYYLDWVYYEMERQAN